MKVLLYESRKIDPIIWDVSTEEKHAKAFLALFNFLDDWGMYYDMDEAYILTNEEIPDVGSKLHFLYDLHLKSKNGDTMSREINGILVNFWLTFDPETVHCEFMDKNGRKWYGESGFNIGEGYEEWT